MTRRYELLLIDSDETVVDFNKCQRQAFTALVAELLPGVDAQSLCNRYVQVNAWVWDRHRAGELTKDELRTIRMVEAFQGYDVDIPRFVNRYERTLASEVHFMPHAIEVLTALAEQCQLVIVTNGIGHVHRTRLEKGRVSHLFAGVIVSDDYGNNTYRKPHPPIFEDAHRRFAPNVAKNQIVMIGDSETSDIQGGANYGIDTCLYTSDTTARTLATHRITDWRQLPEVVGVSD